MQKLDIRKLRALARQLCETDEGRQAALALMELQRKVFEGGLTDHQVYCLNRIAVKALWARDGTGWLDAATALHEATGTGTDDDE